METNNNQTDNSPSAVLARIRQERAQKESQNIMEIGEAKPKSYSIEDLMDC